MEKRGYERLQLQLWRGTQRVIGAGGSRQPIGAAHKTSATGRRMNRKSENVSGMVSPFLPWSL